MRSVYTSSFPSFFKMNTTSSIRFWLIIMEAFFSSDRYFFKVSLHLLIKIGVVVLAIFFLIWITSMSNLLSSLPEHSSNRLLRQYIDRVELFDYWFPIEEDDPEYPSQPLSMREINCYSKAFPYEWEYRRRVLMMKFITWISSS